MSEQPMAYEEVPGTRTLQQAVDQPQRERIAYEELQPGDLVQEGDEWQHDSGRWKPFAPLDGSCVQVRHTQRARRPYRISTILQIGDALANAQKAATQLQDERDEALTALKSAQRARDELQRQVDELRDLVNELHGSVDEIADAGTAADVKEMLCAWATELDYSSDCFDAVGKSQLDIVQKTLITAIARIEIEFGKEGTSAND